MEETRSDTVTMQWEGGRGETVTREVNQIIDVRDYIGTPGYSLLLVAANTHLSIGDLFWILFEQSIELGNPYIERGRSWVQKRRRLFQSPDADNTLRPAGRDGKGLRAAEVMAAHRHLSLRDLTALLNRFGIVRSREWVRQHRCDGVG